MNLYDVWRKRVRGDIVHFYHFIFPISIFRIALALTEVQTAYMVLVAAFNFENMIDEEKFQEGFKYVKVFRF